MTRHDPLLRGKARGGKRDRKAKGQSDPTRTTALLLGEKEQFPDFFRQIHARLGLDASSFQAMLSVALHLVGMFLSVATPVPLGPRKRDQLSAAVAGRREPSGPRVRGKSIFTRS